MNCLPILILIIVNISSILIGAILLFKPTAAIEIQRRFYEKINWRIEPISWRKEIRNTRIMGLILIILGLLTFTYLFIRISFLQLPGF